MKTKNKIKHRAQNNMRKDRKRRWLKGKIVNDNKLRVGKGREYHAKDENNIKKDKNTYNERNKQKYDLTIR